MVTKSMMKYALRLLVIPGSFGLTYQAALISDLISFATFHVYCIYVYAARYVVNITKENDKNVFIVFQIVWFAN